MTTEVNTPESRIKTTIELYDRQTKEMQEMKDAYTDNNNDYEYMITEMIKSYVKRCIVIPKYLSKKDEFLNTDQPTRKSPYDFIKYVRKIDHSDMNSDLFTMMTNVVEEMQENELDRECVKDMFEQVVDFCFEDEDNY
jgi:hypothetical protein